MCPQIGVRDPVLKANLYDQLSYYHHFWGFNRVRAVSNTNYAKLRLSVRCHAIYTLSWSSTRWCRSRASLGAKLAKSSSRNAISEWPPASFSGNIVLVADQNGNILGIDPSGNPTSPTTVTEQIASPGNGCSGIVGVRDVDADGSVEIVFIGGSAQLRYLNQDGTTKKVSNGGVGVNKTILKSSVAAKSPVAPVDVNGDTGKDISD